MTDLNEHLHGHIREPGPGDVSYRGMGLWVVLPIPRAWRTALDTAIAQCPGLAECGKMKELLDAPVLEEDGTITGRQEGYDAL